MKMHEAKLIIPQSCKAAMGYALLVIDDRFGGSTVTEGSGSWKDDTGKLVIEPVYVITIACTDSLVTMESLDAIADNIGRLGKQDCVYIRYPNGRVYLRDTKDTWATLPDGVEAVSLACDAAQYPLVFGQFCRTKEG